MMPFHSQGIMMVHPTEQPYRAVPRDGKFILENDEAIMAGPGDGNPRLFDTAGQALDWARSNGLPADDSEPDAPRAAQEAAPSAAAIRFEQMRAAGTDTPVQNAIDALRRTAGRSDDTNATFWTRWGPVLGSTEIAWRSGQDVVRWMENNLIREPWTDRALPGHYLAVDPSIPTETLRRRSAQFEISRKDFYGTTDRIEHQVRDVEEMGGSAEAIDKARDALATMYRKVAQNERDLQAALQGAEDRERAEHAAALAAQAARYKPADLQELAKKPTPASISGWFAAHHEGRDAWCNGVMADMTGEPHLAGWRDRMNAIQRDSATKPDLAKVIPTNTGERLTVIALHDVKTKDGTGEVFFARDDGRANDNDTVIGLARQYFSYFASKYKGAEFRGTPAVDGNVNPVCVYHEDKLVGVVMPLRLSGDNMPVPTVADIKAKVAGGDAVRAEAAAAAAAVPPAPLDDRERLRLELAAAKFARQSVIIADRQGSEHKFDAHTYRGLAVHRTDFGTGNDWQVTHLNTGLRLGPDFATMANAKLAAARMGDLADMAAIDTPEEAQRAAQDENHGFSRVAKLVRAMQSGRGYGDALAAPELSLGQSARQAQHQAQQQTEAPRRAAPAAPAAPAATTPTPDEQRRAAIEAELMENRPNAPEVARPLAGKTIRIVTRTLGGEKPVNAKLFEIPRYNGPQLAVVEYKNPRGQGYRVYLAKTAMLLEDNNGVTTLDDVLELATLRVRNARERILARHNAAPASSAPAVSVVRALPVVEPNSAEDEPAEDIPAMR